MHVSSKYPRVSILLRHHLDPVLEYHIYHHVKDREGSRFSLVHAVFYLGWVPKVTSGPCHHVETVPSLYKETKRP